MMLLSKDFLLYRLELSAEHYQVRGATMPNCDCCRNITLTQLHQFYYVSYIIIII